MKETSLILLLVSLIGLNSGCQEKNDIEGSNLTAGMAKTKIVNGVTTQAEILSVFGSPNIISKNKSGNEVWTYDRISMEQSSEDGYWNIVVAGKGGSKQKTSTKTFTLMIEFDENEIVKDNSYRVSQF